MEGDQAQRNRPEADDEQEQTQRIRCEGMAPVAAYPVCERGRQSTARAGKPSQRKKPARRESELRVGTESTRVWFHQETE